ncbi:hypothetical protein A1O7_08822 [Cladophialophora yegresii CBS 114405]|uniref:C2H2-type domain-containing protein n=1 Tax=Cladophialophora yegresii CBS 114405 TaxID=1182544 RepID=W9VUS8_9EURO|nr:uncharacterized protein A1O7_08822 [Cladophialophora yegresii CBS 114405]EXJ55891.1 hypothetical protein A1O7_08822 [Cladophialophora yegresii CBS 114405]
MAGSTVSEETLNIMDEAFIQAVETFVETHEPITQTAHLHADLQWFVDAFDLTSQGILVQRQLLMLHDYYNLDDLLEDGILDSMRTIVAASPQSPRPATHPHSGHSVLLLLAQASSLLLDQTLDHPPEDTQIQSPSAGNVTLSSGMPDDVNVSSQAAATSRQATEDAAQTNHPQEADERRRRRPGMTPLAHDVSRQAGNIHVSNLPPLPKHRYPNNPDRCHPPNLEYGFSIAERDKDWMYKCDECGHAFRYRTEFRRHFDGQLGVRDGFKLVCVMPDVAQVWYGVDSHGNEYMGHMLFHPKGEGRLAHHAPIPRPCALRMR